MAKTKSLTCLVIKQKIKFEKTGGIFPFDIANVQLYLSNQEDEKEEYNRYYLDRSTFQVHLNDKGEGFATIAAVHEEQLPKT